MSWWQNASHKARLDQIDGGIECGMLASEIAVASRVETSVIERFGDENGRRFRGRKVLSKKRPSAPPVFDRAQERAAPDFVLDDALSAWAAE